MARQKRADKRSAARAPRRKHEDRPREDRLEALESDVADLTKGLQTVQATSKHLARGIDALVRKAYLPEDLDYPHRLSAARFGVLSQNAEDGVTWAILTEAGVTTRRFAEIGCGTNGGNSGFLAQELGWSGLMVDADSEKIAEAKLRFPRVDVVEAWVTREEISDLLTEHGMTGEIDLLSIDLDGNDYWIWEAIEVCSPRLVIMECNLVFGSDRAVVVPYKPDFDRHDLNPRYYGASLGAMTNLAERKGYRLVCVEPEGSNAYFLRDGLAPHIPAQRAADVWHFPPNKLIRRRERRGKVGDPIGELYDYIKAQELPLVDLDGANDAREVN